MECSLLIVPNTCWVAEVNPFVGVGALVLEDVLNAGLAGVFFKRLRVEAAVQPAKRAEYDAMRHAYLQAVLAEVSVEQRGLLVIGTQPSDVDLFDFDHVAAVKVSDRGMRELGKVVYGDPVMLTVEYTSVLRAVDQAVDVWHHVTSWHELSMLVFRKFPHRVPPALSVTIPRQRVLLTALLVQKHDASVWLEDELRFDFPMRKYFLLADYDYLTVIRPVWRDAVVRNLGRAPGIEEVFRLPWYVVDSAVLGTLCFRPNIGGMPAVSMSGASLVDFVRNRLASVFTARELVGTWVGALLCDDATAVDTLNALGFGTLAPVGDVGVKTSQPFTAVKVPHEFAWMYEAVPGVCAATWEGQVSVEGEASAEGFVPGWAKTLALASLYAECKADSVAAAAVVLLMKRLHCVSVTDHYLLALIAHARVVKQDGVESDTFSAEFTPLLPGYNYLACFAPGTRASALDVLGSYPIARSLQAHAGRVVTVDGSVSEAELHAEAARSMLYSGQTVQFAMDTVTVGDDTGGHEPGYCYLCLFRADRHGYIKNLLGVYPTLLQVLSVPEEMRIDAALDTVRVTYDDDSPLFPWMTKLVVLHFAVRDKGLTLRAYLARGAKGHASAYTVCVGDGQCYSSTWYVLAIISWTVVVVGILGFLGYLLRARCLGGGRGGGGGLGGRGYFR